MYKKPSKTVWESMYKEISKGKTGMHTNFDGSLVRYQNTTV